MSKNGAIFAQTRYPHNISAFVIFVEIAGFK